MKGFKKMNYILFIFILLFIRDLIIVPENTFNDEALSRQQTTSINGIFVMLVFMSHAAQYLNTTADSHQLYKTFQNYLGQGVVVPFLVYSGFGMMEGIKSRGADYIRSIPNKFLKLLLYFNAALVLYFILNLFIGRSYPIGHSLLALTSWTSIGNSNWYITAILLLYLIVYLSFKIWKKHHFLAIITIFCLTIVVVYIQMLLDRPGYTYNTMICFGIGMIYSYFKSNIDNFLKNDFRFFTTFLIIFAVSSLTLFPRYAKGIEVYTIWIITFAVLLLLLTKKMILINPFLDFLGKKVFTVYILQRIPMTLLAHYNINKHYVIFFIASFLGTIILSIIFEKYIIKNINKLLT